MILLKKMSFLKLCSTKKSFKIERIISNGQQTPDNMWLEEDSNEFVLLLEGNSKLKFFGDNNLYDLKKAIG